MAIGSIHTVRKSLIRVPWPYEIRGVAATETRPQPSSSKNLTNSAGCHDVCAAAKPMAARATIGTAPTYQRASLGSRHHSQSRTTAPVSMAVTDEARMFHRSG